MGCEPSNDKHDQLAAAVAVTGAFLMKKRIQVFLDEMKYSCKAGPFIEKSKKFMREMLNDEEFKNELQFHRALGNETRLLIYKLLEQEPQCTCSLAEILEMSEGSITHHLKKLEAAGLVFGKRQGRFTVYYTKEKLVELIS